VSEAADVAGPPRGDGLEHLEEVQKLLSRLPSKERKVVRLYYLEGRSYEEISTELNIPVNTIGPILSRARKKLRAVPTSRRSSPRRNAVPKSEE
jgi:RNA polymerase sigma-70 factor (ECF subfamily)